jgi:hypothetical protein
VLALARPYLRVRRLLARTVARDVVDIRRSGFHVVGVVGVGGSPSCGVETTLDLEASLRALAARPRGPVTAAWMNREVVGAAVRPGRGLFLDALTAELSRRGATVPATEAALEVPDE